MFRILTWSLALTPWAILALGAYWLLEPAPLRIVYVAPHFIFRPALDRDDAASAYVTQIEGGQTLFRYVEYCVDRPFVGTTRRSWINEAMVWAAPDSPTYLSRTPGCRTANIAINVPTSSPTRRFQFVQRLDIDLNPLRNASIDYAPIELTILDTAKK